MGDSLDPDSVAAAIAPTIDRLRLAFVRATGPLVGEIAERTGLPTAVLTPLGMLRNLMPDRLARVDDVVEVFLYQPSEQIRGAVDALVSADMLEAVGDGQIRLAAAGRNVVSELFERSQQFADEQWAARVDTVTTLLPIAERACAAVTESGGAATRVMAPLCDASAASSALRLAELLTPLRFHRFDAHAAAWRAEGLTVEQIQQLEPGPLRQRIEAETNRLSAAPYAVLTADERFTLLTGLGALPN